MIERMYTIKETAEVLRKSPKTVRRYVQSGLLPALRSGLRSVVIPESEIKRYMSSYTISEEQRIGSLIDKEIAKFHNSLDQRQ